MSGKPDGENSVQPGNDADRQAIAAFLKNNRAAVERAAGSDKQTAPYLEALLGYVGAEDQREGDE